MILGPTGAAIELKERGSGAEREPMRRYTVVAAMAALLLCGATAKAELGLDTGISTALVHRYVFRGGLSSPGVGLQSDAYASYGFTDTLSATAYVWNWTSLDAGRGIQEVDLDGSITWVPGIFDGRLSVTGGFVYYDNNNSGASPAFAGPDTYEAYGGLDFDHWLRPSVYAYYDLANVVGTGRPVDGGGSAGLYVVGGIGHSWDLTEYGIDGWWLDADGWIGLDFGRGIDTFSDAGVRLAFSTELEEGLTFGPALDLWFPSNQVDPTTSSFRGVLSVGFAYNKTY